MRTKKNFSKIIWLIVCILIIVIAVYERSKIYTRTKNAEYVTGEVVKIDEGAKGSEYVVYKYFVNNIEYRGSVNIGFCRQCENTCCEKGAKVRVRYDKNNPINSELVHEGLKKESSRV